jgi:thioredoxin-related protein
MLPKPAGMPAPALSSKRHLLQRTDTADKNEYINFACRLYTPFRYIKVYINMRIIVITFIALLALPAFAEPPEGYPFQSFDKAMQHARTENKPLFVYFGRYGCGYCDKTNKEAFSDNGIRETYSKNYVLAYVDAESGKRLRLPSGERVTEREVGTRYNAFVTPVFTFMTTDGEPLLRLVGVQRIEDFQDAHKQVQALLKSAGKP